MTSPRRQVARLGPGVALLISLTSSFALCAGAQEIHFSPEERLDAIDAAIIESAKLSIDFAAYSLTDGAVVEALNAAERRGVMIGSFLIRMRGTTSFASATFRTM